MWGIWDCFCFSFLLGEEGREVEGVWKQDERVGRVGGGDGG